MNKYKRANMNVILFSLIGSLTTAIMKTSSVLVLLIIAAFMLTYAAGKLY
jgi:hypothetical protein